MPEVLIQKLQGELGGWHAQREMMPAYRTPLTLQEVERKQPKRAGVVAHIYPGELGWELLYMKRTSYLGVHSAQISFPGGQLEQTDKDLQDAAYREAQEEVGLGRDQFLFSRALSWLYIPPSNFYVQPFVTVGAVRPELSLDPVEVDRTFGIPINSLLSGELIAETEVKSGTYTFKVPAYHFDNEVIWGATAMITSEILALFR